MVCRSQRRRWKNHSAITILTTVVVLLGYLLDERTQPCGGASPRVEHGVDELEEGSLIGRRELLDALEGPPGERRAW